MSHTEEVIRRVLSAYTHTEGAVVTPMAGGLVNRSYRVQGPEGRFVLQSLHPIFKAELHEDIDAVTAHLARKDMLTPRLVRSERGTLFVIEEGVVWRMLSFVEGRSFDAMPNATVAAEAGALVGRFHAATADLRHDFRFARLAVHDTPAHLQKLRAALRSHADHRDFARIAPTAEEILTRASALPPIDARQARIAHGDLKISNLLFDAAGHGLCLVDLDTLARMPLAHELGDAWRSWCNPKGEDAPSTRFDCAILAASARAYFAHNAVSREERQTLAVGIETITLELSARFCADALLENYFGWNPDKYPDRSTHNRVRAEGQLALARSIAEVRQQITRILEEA